jgi:hypothetical protein
MVMKIGMKIKIKLKIIKIKIKLIMNNKLIKN